MPTCIHKHGADSPAEGEHGQISTPLRQDQAAEVGSEAPHPLSARWFTSDTSYNSSVAHSLQNSSTIYSLWSYYLPSYSLLTEARAGTGNCIGPSGPCKEGYTWGQGYNAPGLQDYNAREGGTHPVPKIRRRHSSTCRT